MGSYRELQEATTANYGPRQVSGVHESPTHPAPYVEEPMLFGNAFLGSVPADALRVLFQPLVALRSGKTFAFEALPRCEVEGLTEAEDLYARATFEKKMGELGRALRRIAFTECLGVPVFIGVHPHELKDSWLIRPDDPLSTHDAQVFLQLDQPSYSAVCVHVLSEVASRGISLVVDDLGAGASNLKQVIELGPAFVKLDAELVRDIDKNIRKRKVVAAMTRMCSELGAQMIAKGIETEAELRAVVDAGVLYGQGRLLGEPSLVPTVSDYRLRTG
jgi:EAL domain-containing protein (putative c-di-GMP-specific phosphodiesterase class I)